VLLIVRARVDGSDAHTLAQAALGDQECTQQEAADFRRKARVHKAEATGGS